MKIEDLQLVKRIFEAALMAADRPLQRRDLTALFDDLEVPKDELVDQAIEELGEDCESRGYELKRVASGYRYQVKQDLSRWISKLWQERAPRYSRALLETLSLVAYRQPITRGEIEEIRGVAVSTQIVKTLLEREWIKSVGHRDAPGRPAIYATTRQFLDYFNLKSLDQLPTLSEIRDLSTISRELNIELPVEATESANDESIDEGRDSEASEENREVVAELTEAIEPDEDTIVEDNVLDESALDESVPEESSYEENALEENVVEDSGSEHSVIEQTRSEPNEEIAAFESWIDDELVEDEISDSKQSHQSELDEEQEQTEMQASSNSAGELKL